MASCWDNSKFVSECTNDNKCLCNDPEFQSVSPESSALPEHAVGRRSSHSYPQVVYQCLHSQCQTAQFAPALHCALTECFSHSLETSNTPRLIQQQHPRKRNPYHSVSGYASASAGPSGYHHLRNSISGSAHPFPTRSVVGSFGRGYSLRASQSVSATLTPKDSPGYGNSTTPISSAPVITPHSTQFSLMPEPYTFRL
jgi:hypothetical protein